MTLLKRTVPLILVTTLLACIDLPDIEPADPSTIPDSGNPSEDPDGGPPDSGVPDGGNAVCGDGKTEGTEACDDGNTVDETTCPYGTATCTACNATCTGRLELTGLYCGDGIVSLSERCDDGNTSACGGCDATCSQEQSYPASGSIYAGDPDDIADGPFLDLNDGINPIVRFELDKDGSVQANAVRVDIAGTIIAADVADRLSAAINSPGKPLQIRAQIPLDSPGFLLYHNLRTSFGNQPITGSAINTAVTVQGMTGGKGSDCPADTRCAQTADCAPGLVCRLEKVCGPP
jgi:cysteine-rich repeat protein